MSVPKPMVKREHVLMRLVSLFLRTTKDLKSAIQLTDPYAIGAIRQYHMYGPLTLNTCIAINGNACIQCAYGDHNEEELFTYTSCQHGPIARQKKHSYLTFRDV